MRDPNRIDNILSELKSYWISHPDMRLGQIIGNCSGLINVDPFYLEDDDFIKSLRVLRGRENKKYE